MLIKSVEFNNQFIYDLASIVFSSRQYEKELTDILSTLDEGEPISVGYQKKQFKNVQFVGSYTNKKDGEYLTDIDVIQYVKFNENLVKRISQIMKNLQYSNFIFARFYCGFVNDLQIPWQIDAEGSCNVNLDNIEEWLKNAEIYLPPNIYREIRKIYDQKSLSLEDLLNIESIVEPYATLIWSQEELIKTYKIHNGHRYELLEVLLEYPKKKVFKYMYTYPNDEKNYEYCLIDVSIKEYQKISKIKKSEDFEMKAYYQNDQMKMAKYMKKYLPSDIRMKRDEMVKERISKYTPLAGRIELIDKCIKYKLLDDFEINRLKIDAQFYAFENSIETIDYSQLQDIIYKNTKDIYDIFRPFILPEYERLFNVFEIRGEEAKIKISKEILRERSVKGYSCIFFPIDIEDLNNLIDSALNSMIQPKELLKSVYKSCEENDIDVHDEVKKLFKDIKKDELKIVQEEFSFRRKKFNLVDKRNNIIHTSPNINELRVFTIFGLKKL